MLHDVLPYNPEKEPEVFKLDKYLKIHIFMSQYFYVKKGGS